MKNQNIKIFLETMNLEYYRLKKGPVGLLLVRGSQLGNSVGENVHRAYALNDMKISEQHAFIHPESFFPGNVSIISGSQL